MACFYQLAHSLNGDIVAFVARLSGTGYVNFSTEGSEVKVIAAVPLWRCSRNLLGRRSRDTCRSWTAFSITGKYVTNWHNYYHLQADIPTLSSHGFSPRNRILNWSAHGINWSGLSTKCTMPFAESVPVRSDRNGPLIKQDWDFWRDRSTKIRSR